MAKSPKKGHHSSDEEEEDNDPETVAEMNRIMGRDKPPKQTSGGLSLAERAQLRMKAAQTQKTSTNPSSLKVNASSHHGSSSSLSTSHSPTDLSVLGIKPVPQSPHSDSDKSPTAAMVNPSLAQHSRVLSKTSVPLPDPVPSTKKDNPVAPEPSILPKISPAPIPPHTDKGHKEKVREEPEFEPPEDDDDEEPEAKNTKKKKKGFFGKLKKVVGRGSDSEEENDQVDPEMQKDIDRIMRGRVTKPSAPSAGKLQAKPLSIEERAALAQKRAYGKH